MGLLTCGKLYLEWSGYYFHVELHNVWLTGYISWQQWLQQPEKSSTIKGIMGWRLMAKHIVDISVSKALCFFDLVQYAYSFTLLCTQCFFFCSLSVWSHSIRVVMYHPRSRHLPDKVIYNNLKLLSQQDAASVWTQNNMQFSCIICLSGCTKEVCKECFASFMVWHVASIDYRAIHNKVAKINFKNRASYFVS